MNSMGNREEDKDNVRMSFQSKVFYNRLIIFSWFVYSKSAIFKAIQNPVHKHRAILYRKIGQATSTAGRQGAARSWTSEKEVKQAAGSHESKGAETAGRSTTRQAGRGGGRELQDNEGQAVSNRKPLTVGAIHPPKPLPCPVSPGCQPGKRARERAMMEAQPFEKTRLSQHLMLLNSRESFFFRSGGRQVNVRA